MTNSPNPVQADSMHEIKISVAQSIISSVLN